MWASGMHATREPRGSECAAECGAGVNNGHAQGVLDSKAGRRTLVLRVLVGRTERWIFDLVMRADLLAPCLICRELVVTAAAIMREVPRAQQRYIPEVKVRCHESGGGAYVSQREGTAELQPGGCDSSSHEVSGRKVRTLLISRLFGCVLSTIGTIAREYIAHHSAPV